MSRLRPVARTAQLIAERRLGEWTPATTEVGQLEQDKGISSVVGWFRWSNWGRPSASLTTNCALSRDVAWDQDGTAEEKLQIKHTIHAKGGLGDKSPEMWKTIKAWLDDGQAVNIDGPALKLVSTGTAQQESAAYLLKDLDTRNAAADAGHRKQDHRPRNGFTRSTRSKARNGGPEHLRFPDIGRRR